MKKRRTGRKPEHGAYSIVSKTDLIRDRKRLSRYLREAREGMISDFGGERALTTAQSVLIDRALTKLGTLRLIELWIAKKGVFEREGELRPILKENYLQWTRELRNDLNSLGINVRKDGESLTLAEIIKEKTEEKESVRSSEKETDQETGESRQDDSGEAIEGEEGERVEEELPESGEEN